MKTFFFGFLALFPAILSSNSWNFQPGESTTILDEKVISFPVHTLVDNSHRYLNQRHYWMGKTHADEYSREQCLKWNKPLQLELKPELYQDLISRDRKKISYHLEFLTTVAWINTNDKKDLRASGNYSIDFDQYLHLADNQPLDFNFQDFEHERVVPGESFGWIIKEIKLNLEQKDQKPQLTLTGNVGLNLATSLKTFQKYDYFGIDHLTETYLQKIIIKIDTQKENLTKIPTQYHTLVDKNLTSDPKVLKRLYLERLTNEVFPKVSQNFNQTIWDFARFENECNWTNYNPKLATNRFNFALYPLDPQKQAKIKFQLFVQKEITMKLNFSKHYQLKVPVETWVELIKKQVVSQGYPSEWLTYTLGEHQLTLQSANPSAFHFEPMILTYEMVKPPVPHKKEPAPDKSQEKPKETNPSKSEDKPKEKLVPKEKGLAEKPKVKAPEDTQKVPAKTSSQAFNPKYLYFLFIPFGILTLYLIIFFWKKHKHKKGKC